MLTLPSMTQIIEWFGWGDGAGALAAISVILTVLVLLAPGGVRDDPISYRAYAGGDHRGGEPGFRLLFREFRDLPGYVCPRDGAPELRRDYGGRGQRDMYVRG